VSFALLRPREVSRVRYRTTIGEQTLQLRASVRVRNGTMKRIPLEPLYMKRTNASIWIFQELEPDSSFTFHGSFPRHRCSWRTREEEPWFWKSKCRSVQLCKSFLLEIITYNLSNKCAELQIRE
jgi:hypothetical protein